MMPSLEHLFRKSILLGYGALGISLTRIIESRALTFSFIIDPSPKTVPGSHGTWFEDLSQIPAEFKPSLIIIAVQDAQILSATKAINNRFKNLKECLIVHTSGSTDLSVLENLKKKGATIGSWHPMMSFTVRQPITSIEGIITGIDGDKKAIDILSSFSRHLGAIPFHINESNRVLYHLLGVFASNFLVAYLALLEEIFQQITINNPDISFDALKPIMQKTMTNVFSDSPAKALSGPVQRKDYSTIQKHLEVLKEKMPHLLPFYKQMTFKLAETAKYSDSERITLEQLMEKL